MKVLIFEASYLSLQMKSCQNAALFTWILRVATTQISFQGWWCRKVKSKFQHLAWIYYFSRTLQVSLQCNHLFSVLFCFYFFTFSSLTQYYKSTDYFNRTVVVTVLPDNKTLQKMPNCGSIGPNFVNLLNNK